MKWYFLLIQVNFCECVANIAKVSLDSMLFFLAATKKLKCKIYFTWKIHLDVNGFCCCCCCCWRSWISWPKIRVYLSAKRSLYKNINKSRWNERKKKQQPKFKWKIGKMPADEIDSWFIYRMSVNLYSFSPSPLSLSFPFISQHWQFNRLSHLQ